MYQNILVTTGGSPWSEAAVAYAIAIAAQTGAHLHILTVLVHPGVYAYPDVIGGSDLVSEVIERDARDLLWQAAEKAHQAGVICETAWRWGSVIDTILQTVEETPYDLVVIGARKVSGWKRLRLGHIANAVAAKARQPVLVVKQPPAAMIHMPFGQRFLVATGGSPWSEAAITHALKLAQGQCATICFLHVLSGHRASVEAEEEGRRILDRAEARAKGTGVAITSRIARGDIASAIIDTAVESSCDTIIVGSRGSSGWKRLMVGSISNAVAVKTDLPVLIVKRFLPL